MGPVATTTLFDIGFAAPAGVAARALGLAALRRLPAWPLSALTREGSGTGTWV